MRNVRLLKKLYRIDKIKAVIQVRWLWIIDRPTVIDYQKIFTLEYSISTVTVTITPVLSEISFSIHFIDNNYIVIARIKKKSAHYLREDTFSITSRLGAAGRKILFIRTQLRKRCVEVAFHGYSEICTGIVAPVIADVCLPRRRVIGDIIILADGRGKGREKYSQAGLCSGTLGAFAQRDSRLSIVYCRDVH